MSEPTQRLPVVEREPDAEGPLGQSASAADYEPQPTLEGEEKPARFWSGRRVPAAIAALVLLGGFGILLYDVAAVRAGQPAMQWRRSLADHLAQWHLDDTAVLIGAGVAAALGLWLIVLALTPGLRAVLPMRRTHTDVRAGLHRDAAAMVLRDRAMEVSGVQSVRVRMKRKKVEARAVSHFRELDDVRADLDATLSDGIRELGLGSAPGLSVHVARPGRKG
ncbi:DUF6286 domain-containing protein [Streptomyces sp. VRA16 Mangrove soil]|uniref:DUF6286 domain-containing protein n=1 Tax=Streptomyces sp. VRA16 Mangrove soil TaxID=2817434 RepID=UPI001A9D50E5|nr:DUF6286 domain-containing protein [Streptomyces sp. VRA16 Mangrove soil]MBO1335199.1 hypothetical protein [Streptomyces sp. VRA16 Mangrove soil]